MFIGKEVAQISPKYFSHIEQHVMTKDKIKLKPTPKKQGLGANDANTSNVLLDSPSMNTRSKKKKKHNYLVLQWVQEAKEALALDFWNACSLICDAMYYMLTWLG